MSDSLPETERCDPRFRAVDSWDTTTGLAALWQHQLAAVAAIGPALPALATAVDAAAGLLRAGGRLGYVGAGTSGRLAAQDAAELTPTFGWPVERASVVVAGGPEALRRAVEGAEDDSGAGEAAVARLGGSDVLVALAASGRTPFTVAGVMAARRRGVLTIAFANVPDSPLLRAAAHPILLHTGAEPIAGSTRMGAGTAQRAALTMFSTMLMVRLGRVFEGRMVCIQPTNAKLRERAVRFVREITGAEPADALAALEAGGGDVRRAVLLLRGLNVDVLDVCHGDLRAALAVMP